MSEKRQVADVESEHLAALRAAIQVGDDDLEAGTYESVDNPDVWVAGIAKLASTAPTAHTPM